MRPGTHGDDLLFLSPTTEAWLRDRYKEEINTDSVRRDLGEILAHGEPERASGQGEAAEEAAEPSAARAFWDGEATPTTPVGAPGGDAARTDAPTPVNEDHGGGAVVVDFGGHGPEAV